MVPIAVRDFLEAYENAKKAVDQGDRALARTAYANLLRAYERLNQCAVRDYHKELAYEQVLKVRERVEKLARPVPRTVFIAAAGLVLVLSLLIAFRPAIVGLAGFQERFTEQLDLEITGSRALSLTLQGIPTSFRVTGSVDNGHARISLARGKTLLLVVDTAKEKLIDGRFARVCVETCEDIEGIETNTAQLVIELDPGATMLLEAIHYRAAPLPNKPPKWIGTTTKLTINGPTTIDLDDYFTDPDDADLVYLATMAEGLKVIVQGSQLMITPEPGVEGETKTITVYASDLKRYTKVKLEVTIALSGTDGATS